MLIWFPPRRRKQALCVEFLNSDSRASNFLCSTSHWLKLPRLCLPVRIIGTLPLLLGEQGGKTYYIPQLPNFPFFLLKLFSAKLQENKSEERTVGIYPLPLFLSCFKWMLPTAGPGSHFRTKKNLSLSSPTNRSDIKIHSLL